MFDLKKAAEKDRTFIDETWEKWDKKLSIIAVRSRDKCPYTTRNGVHTDRSGEEICRWTNGFWGGLMWLMYIGTKNEEYKITAERNEEILDRAFKKFYGLHHDVGFMWLLTSGVNYRISGNEQSRLRTIYAASLLAARFNAEGKFLRAWNDEPCVTIIDSMMNIPLLYWAAKEIGDPRYRHIAMQHADTTMQNHIRPDGSIKHICVYDAESGEYLEHRTGQGYDLNSSWSRGQAWALYGFTLSYIHTKKQEYLDTAKKVAHYFISCVCDDYLPKADLRSPEEPVLYDTTAGACAACGLLELARALPKYEGQIYYNAAIKMLKAMEEKFCNYDLDEDSVLQMGTEYWTDDPKDLDEHTNIPLIYGDYYFAEALYKLKGYDLLFE